MACSTTYTGQEQQRYSFDAWGRPKAVFDKSLLHAMFTFNVPADKWYESLNDVEQSTFTYATSVNGALNMSSSTNADEKITLSTFRHPRYQPNRGHLYSTSAIFPNKNDLGIRRFGIFTKESGVFFELDSGVLYGVVRTTVDSITSETRKEIICTDYDLEKGNIFDIQMQWRGVGDYKFYINEVLACTIKNIGRLTNLSMFNPANPMAFEAINKGNRVSFLVGCADLTSEGGGVEGGSYGSVSISNVSGQVSISGFNQPVLAIRSKTTVGGKVNTRDTLALLASSYANERCIFRVWATRDLTAITPNNQSWTDFRDGHLEYIEYNNPTVTTPMTFNTSKADLIFSCRTDQDQTYATSALFEGRTDIYLTPGDMFVFTMHRENGIGATVGVTFEFSEEI